MKPEDIKIALFILSTGRTGTTALAEYMGELGGRVTSVHEPKPSRVLRIASNRYLCGRMSRTELIRRYHVCRKNLFRRIETPVYIESNPFLHGFIEVLGELLPSPKVLHIVRDPRTYVPSYINYGGLSGLKGLAVRFLPFWMIKPDLLEPQSGLRWNAMSDIERFAWRWDRVNGILDKGAAIYGDQYRRVRFEDIFADPAAAITDICQWIGLEEKYPTPAKKKQYRRVNASVRRRVSPWEEWEETDRHTLYEFCGERMVRYGYES